MAGSPCVARHCIHALGPRLANVLAEADDQKAIAAGGMESGQSASATQLLGRAYRAALRAALGAGAKSVAVPPLIVAPVAASTPSASIMIPVSLERGVGPW